MEAVSLPRVIITNSTELKHEIMKLNYMKEEQEITLRNNVKEIYYSLQLSTIIRKTVNELSEDTHLKKTVVTKGIEMGSSFLLNKFMFKNGTGVKGFLVGIGLKKLVSIILSRKQKNISKKENPE
ncbi:MAG: hypothetical protein H7296_12500 [Bacteroidia bacterium]|nr:hypothetical protein [Bacteroidia bacterium]